MRFYLLDRITRCEPGRMATGLKNVAMSEDFLDEHFAGVPVFPGSMILESMAQLAGYLLARTACPDEPHKHKAVLSMVERAKFRKVVRPGDQLLLTAELLSIMADAGKVSCRAQVEGSPVAEARLLFYFADLENDLLEANRKQIFSIWTTGASG